MSRLTYIFLIGILFYTAFYISAGQRYPGTNPAGILASDAPQEDTYESILADPEFLPYYIYADELYRDVESEVSLGTDHFIDQF